MARGGWREYARAHGDDQHHRRGGGELAGRSASALLDRAVGLASAWVLTGLALILPFWLIERLVYADVEVPPASHEWSSRPLVLWLIAAFLIRRLPSRPGRPLGRPRPRVVAAATAVAVVLLAVPAAYAFRHPVSATAPECFGGDQCDAREGRVLRPRFEIRNDGRHPITLLAADIEGIPPALRLERVRHVPYGASARDHALPQSIAPGSSLTLIATMRLSPNGCEGLLRGDHEGLVIGPATGIRTRYRVRGRETTQRLLIRPAPRILHCQGPHGGWYP